MTFEETVNYLFNSAPLFQNVGAGAYKEGLSNTHKLDEHFCHPHTHYKTVHVAGTNGKGSCSHTLASILQASGLKVGLFTSPHLVDFRERIRVNGQMISKEFVVDFVEKERNFFESLHPSFFELTTAMAFKYFEEQNVDIAVVEVGLGGRLDCTNIITPVVSVITNISFDHTAFLGDTLQKIASEKAGIIKKGIPVVIGESVKETRNVFERKANEVNSPILFAEDKNNIINYQIMENGRILYNTTNYGLINGELGGFCQIKNTNTILNAIDLLKEQGFDIKDTDVHKGFANVCEMTGLMGRWQTIQERPKVVCDTGHNVGGFEWITKQLNEVACHKRIVFGMVNDKDIDGVLNMLPKNATYYYCEASVKRAMQCGKMKELAFKHGLDGMSCGSVAEAYNKALEDSDEDDFIYVGGSSFVVADLLTHIGQNSNLNAKKI